jgi:Diacylglycerol kinase
MSKIKDRIQSFKYAFSGLRTLLAETPNARIYLMVSVVAVILGCMLHISKEEWLAVIIVIGVVFAMEAINTSLEILSDYACKKEIHPSIKRVKDLAAAGVLVAAVVALAVGIIVFLPKIIILFA